MDATTPRSSFIRAETDSFSLMGIAVKAVRAGILSSIDIKLNDPLDIFFQQRRGFPKKEVVVPSLLQACMHLDKSPIPEIIKEICPVHKTYSFITCEYGML